MDKKYFRKIFEPLKISVQTGLDSSFWLGLNAYICGNMLQNVSSILWIDVSSKSILYDEIIFFGFQVDMGWFNPI